MVNDVVNGLFVKLFRRVPWLASQWARRRRFVESQDIPWTPLAKPLPESVLAVVTTAGVHLKSQAPFNMDDPDGDPSFRPVPTDVRGSDLTITHRYYDQTAAKRDVNVVLPLDRMRELCAEGRIAGIAPFAYGFMGHIDGPHLRTLMEHTAPEVARRLKADRADAVILTPA